MTEKVEISTERKVSGGEGISPISNRVSIFHIKMHVYLMNNVPTRCCDVCTQYDGYGIEYPGIFARRTKKVLHTFPARQLIWLLHQHQPQQQYNNTIISTTKMNHNAAATTITVEVAVALAALSAIAPAIDHS